MMLNKNLLVAWISINAISAFAENTNSLIEVFAPSDAISHEGKTVTIKGLVEDQRTIETGTTFLNFGGTYPNHVFSCRLLALDFPEGVSSFVGKTVEVTGLIKIYKGKPSMDLAGPDKIKVLEEAPAAEAPSP